LEATPKIVYSEDSDPDGTVATERWEEAQDYEEGNQDWKVGGIIKWAFGWTFRLRGSTGQFLNLPFIVWL
jgi:hypothetical protein